MPFHALKSFSEDAKTKSIIRCYLKNQFHFLPDYVDENIQHQSFVLKSEIHKVLSGEAMTSSGQSCFQHFVSGRSTLCLACFEVGLSKKYNCREHHCQGALKYTLCV